MYFEYILGSVRKMVSEGLYLMEPVFCQLPNTTRFQCYANSALECIGACSDIVALI